MRGACAWTHHQFTDQQVSKSVRVVKGSYSPDLKGSADAREINVARASCTQDQTDLKVDGYFAFFQRMLDGAAHTRLEKIDRGLLCEDAAWSYSRTVTEPL